VASFQDVGLPSARELDQAWAHIARLPGDGALDVVREEAHSGLAR